MLRHLLWLLPFLGFCFVGAAFAIQNAGRTTELSLNLGVAAWALAEPVRVPTLMGACVLAGAMVAAAAGWARTTRLRRRVEELEQQALLNRASVRAHAWSEPAAPS